jgi:hypothetical protein
MIRTHFDDWNIPGIQVLAKFLDIPDDDARRFFHMIDQSEPASPESKVTEAINDRTDAFGDLPLDKQKVVLFDVLHTYRAEPGRVAWKKAMTLVHDHAV